MTELTDNSNTDEIVAYIGECIALYPDKLSTDQVAYDICALGRFDWENSMSHKYDAFCSMMDLASDMEWQEQPGDWQKLLNLYQRLKWEVADKKQG